ncbi:MAG: hypothetical protein K0Q68_296 [Moraxellaceae bacterium]|nr:hypothetical protein [Moraxellaceae bacterium]
MPLPFWLIGAGVAALLTAAAASGSDDDDDAEEEKARRRARATNARARREAHARNLLNHLSPRLTALLAGHEMGECRHDVSMLLGDPWAAEAILVEDYLETPAMKAIDRGRRQLRLRIRRLEAAEAFLTNLEEDLV